MMLSKKLVSQYRQLKGEVADCVLLMQVGAFMQAMGEDARTLSEQGGVKLQMAGDVDDPVVLGGFPVSGLDAYIGRLVRKGSSVALAMQCENKDRRIAETIRLQAGSPVVGEGTGTRVQESGVPIQGIAPPVAKATRDADALRAEAGAETGADGHGQV